MTRKKLDDNGLLYLLSKLLLLFVRSEPGKGLSQNDLTDELKTQILGQFSGSWNDLTNRPVNVSTWMIWSRHAMWPTGCARASP